MHMVQSCFACCPGNRAWLDFMQLCVCGDACRQLLVLAAVIHEGLLQCRPVGLCPCFCLFILLCRVQAGGICALWGVHTELALAFICPVKESTFQ